MATTRKRSTRSQAAGKRASVAAKAPAKARAKAPAKPPATRAVSGASPAPARVARPVSGAGITRGKYVYCIIRAGQGLKFGPIGIGTEPAEVHTVNFKEIAAVVS